MNIKHIMYGSIAVVMIAFALVFAACKGVTNPAKPKLTGTVSLNNHSPKVGESVAAAYESGNGTGAQMWQWFRADGTDELIPDAAASTYTVTAADVGKKIKVQLSFADQIGSVSATTTNAVTAAAPQSAGITYEVVQTGGADKTADSNGIVFTFSASVDSLHLTAADISVSGAAEKAANAELSGEGATRTLAITVSETGQAVVQITKDGIEAETKPVTVYKAGEASPVTKMVTAMAIKTQPAKLTYTHGDTLDLSGLEVRLTYDDHNTDDVGLDDFTLKGITTHPANSAALSHLTHNAHPVEVSYSGKTADTNNLTVSKANPNVTWPTGLTAAYGQTLSAVSLASHTNGGAGAFAWDSPNDTAGALGAQSHSMTFTPTDQNYNTATQNVSITVSKANPVVTWPTAAAINSGAALSTSVLTGGGASVEGYFAWTNGAVIPTATNSGYEVTFTPTDTVNYNTLTHNVNIMVIQAEVVSPTGVEMVYVAGGGFMMGQNLGSGGGDNTSPVHAVTLSGFYIGKYEITQEQYQTVMGTNPSYFTTANGRAPVTGETAEKRPVEYVTWYDAVEFCNKLSERESLTPVYTITNRTPASGYPITGATVTANWSNNGYRLPAEAEWEYAAKGGNPTAAEFAAYTFPGGDTIGNVAWYTDNSSNRTHEVGKKASNKLGIYDMGGNVFEWCWDWYGGYSSAAQINPIGPALEDSDNGGRVRRGGSYNYASTTVRSAYRSWFNPFDTSNSNGFRIVKR